MSMLQDLESKASSGESFSHEEAERVLACADLVLSLIHISEPTRPY